nr:MULTISPECIES: hypothetical protein [Burkholderiaceae]
MRENAQRQAARDLSTIKALVDLMVRDHDLSFRAAHLVEGAVVHRAMDNRVPADLIDAEMVESAAIEQLGKPLGIDAEAVRVSRPNQKRQCTHLDRRPEPVDVTRACEHRVRTSERSKSGDQGMARSYRSGARRSLGRNSDGGIEMNLFFRSKDCASTLALLKSYGAWGVMFTAAK